ncbi:MAG: class I SAM-dependent methyltransferase [Solirubrobacterales bacterium]|nr:class I SAM-dependent methyltransferase [Solirubrobacterales bacterium]
MSARGAQALGLHGIECVRGEAAAIPLPDATADLFLSLWGLHRFPDPAAAIGDAARVLAPGGRLVGCTFVRGSDSLRQRLLIRPGLGDFGNVATAAETESYLAAAGLAVTALERRGPMLYFDARAPA